MLRCVTLPFGTSLLSLASLQAAFEAKRAQAAALAAATKTAPSSNAGPAASSSSSNDRSGNNGDDDDSLTGYVTDLAHVVAPACFGCCQSFIHAHERGKYCMKSCCLRHLCGLVVSVCMWLHSASPRQRLACGLVLACALAAAWWYLSVEATEALATERAPLALPDTQPARLLRSRLPQQ